MTLNITAQVPLCWMSLCWVFYSECHYSECHYAECHYAKCHYAECHNAECHYAECQYAESHYAECHYAECHYAECHYAECHVPFYTSIRIICIRTVLNILYPWPRIVFVVSVRRSVGSVNASICLPASLGGKQKCQRDVDGLGASPFCQPDLSSSDKIEYCGIGTKICTYLLMCSFIYSSCSFSHFFVFNSFINSS
jgi:hypothetical protein